MAEAIKQNTSPQSLYVDASGTQMSDVSGCAMAEAIKQNTTLRSLGINAVESHMSEKSIEAMVEAFNQNSTFCFSARVHWGFR